MTIMDISQEFIARSRYYLSVEYPAKIAHCLETLPADALWRRVGDDSNSVGNLLLHLAGNVRQWIVSGVGGAEDHRLRSAEFAAREIGAVQIQNRGTLGGSIAFADPAAELPACLLALDGEVDATGPKGKRTIKAADFFKGLFETALGPQDVLTAIRIPAAGKDTRVGFAELARRHGDYAIVGLAASARADGKGLADVRLAFFGVGATAMRAKKAEAALASGNVDAAVAALDLEPQDDVQATGAVKKHLAGVLLRRVAMQLLEARS